MNAWPTISCLTVTLDRFELLREAIDCFVRQSYPHKELVIVSDGRLEYLAAIADHLALLGRPEIRLVAIEGRDLPLGRLRNLAIEAAGGELICQWDDDDLYHPERLSRQWNHLRDQHATACYLTDQLQLFVASGELYWTDWQRAARPTEDGRWSCIPGTLLMVKNAACRYPESGPQARRGEDSALLPQVFAQGPVARLAGQGPLYIYRCHGANTFEDAHHRGLLRGALGAAELELRRGELSAALASYTLETSPILCAPGHALGPIVFMEVANVAA